ncbi:uncharacterized protein [Leuresthes tenuis]|uniref:uncharacterized protein n=1 Tax=Leuresthes tenuis TaxID=355514 RepID=UPI003B50E733
MASEKSAEVVGCDASIMMNVWEIRLREHGQKIQLEQQRVEKSALPIINQDWANRLASKQGGYKRVERKPKPQETLPDNNVWKSKQPTAPRAPLRGVGSGAPGRPGIQSKSFSTPTTNFKKGQNKTVQDKSFNRQQLFMYLTKTQPPTMVWGKAWKYNKSLPPPAEGSPASSDWGQCWMFATQQPHTEAGKPWPNEPNVMDPHSLHFWRKPHFKMVESQQLDFSLSADEWHKSWQRPEEMKKKTSVNGENDHKSGFFTLLVETQRHNEALYSSEWIDSWQSTKPANQEDHFTNEGLMDRSNANKQDEDIEISSEWEECWKLSNHHGGNNFKPQHQKVNRPQWASSWRAATASFSGLKNSDHGSGDHGQQKESHSHRFISVPHTRHHRHLYLQLCNEFEAHTEWNKSWQVPKNNSKPCEEIEKALKTPPPKMDAAKEGQKEHHPAEKADPRYEQLRHDVMYQKKREFTQSKLLLLKQLEKMLPSSDWRDCWKMIKHSMRMERRRFRPDPLKPFKESAKGGDTKPTSSEWKNSWKYQCKPLSQDPDLWQQGWSTTAQIRANWERHQNEFEPEEFPRNGPTGKQVWSESWKFIRHQHRSEPGQISQGKSSVPSHHHDHSQEQEQRTRSISDWHKAWMVSVTQFHHDKPSLVQWREAWKWSIYHTLRWTEHVPRDKWVDEAAEIQHLKRGISFQRGNAKISRSFDSQIFRERYPEKEWRSSWSAVSLLEHQPSYYGSLGQNKSSPTQQQNIFASEYKSKWGRSFRLANPMPQLEQPWVKSCPNPVHYAVRWSRGKRTQKDMKSSLHDSSVTLKLWANSLLFLQGHGSRAGGRSKSKVPSDPRVILEKKPKARKHLYSNMEKEKQVDKKLAGCHLLGKTQPRPKKGRCSMKQLKPEENGSDQLYEKWVESWKFFIRPGNLRKQKPFKSPLGWNESWKFLFPPYAPVSDIKEMSKVHTEKASAVKSATSSLPNRDTIVSIMHFSRSVLGRLQPQTHRFKFTDSIL